MKSGKLILLFVMIVAGSLALVAQTQPNLLNGMPPLGSYDGSNVDTVNLVNGNLTLHIPLPFDYPQRGSLGIKYYFVINSKTWEAQGDPNTMTGQWWPASACGTATSGPCGQDAMFASTASFGMTREWTKVWPDGQAPTYSATIPDKITTWDGSSHDVAGTALDTSGYSVQVSGDDGTGVYTTATIIDRNGTQYIGQFPTGGLGSCSVDGNGLAGSTQTTTCTQQWTLTSVMDANGNVLNPPVPIPGTIAQATFASAHQAVGAESAGCFTAYGTPWIYYFSYPAPNGQTNQLKLCFAPYPQLATSFSQSGVHQFQDNYSGHPFPGTWRPPVYLTNVILSDNTQWSLTYDSYGEVTSLGTPTGSTIQYGWGEGSFPRCNVAGNDITKVSRAVFSRTITDANGHSFTWNYQWTPQATDGTLTHTVTDSSRNDSAHVFKDLTAADITPVCDFRETQTLSYQGTGGSRKPLQQVDTTWLHNRQVRGVPTDLKTTVFPSQKVSLVHMDYDPSALPIGIVTSKKTYDWGQGGPGALLREEDTVYQWQKDSRYLTANLLDLPASKVVISPVPASNVKSSCPVDDSGTLKACMAETDYTYDEPTYLTSYENTVGALPSGSHVAAPNPVRGNLTTVSSWLSTGGPVISHTNWYDTGEAYQAIDPLGHLTTHSYDLAYRGVLPTKTCNAKNQCVSATYDLNTGLLTSFTDANGSYPATGTTPGDPAHTTSYTYDLMRRMTIALSPADPNGSHPQTTFNFPNATTIQQSRTITSLSDSLTTHIDGLGHVSRREHATPAGTALADLTYSGSGHVVTASNPYFTTSDPTYGVTTNTYDGLDRVTQATKQDGSISHVAYNVVTAATVSGDCTQTTDEAGKQHGACSDALGRLVEVDEPSGTPVQANYHALMQQDGNFVLLNAAGTSVWSTGSGTTNAASIFMQDDGNLVTYIFKWQAGVYAAPSPGPFPSSSCSIGTYLVAGEILPSGKCIVSPHGQYFLLMNTDGNFFIYDWAHGTGTWGPGTQGHPGAYAIFQTDGNLVVYDINGTALWNSGTSGTYAERLDMNDDGRILIWKSAWNSGTSNGQFNGTTYTHPGCDVGVGTGTTGLLWSGQCFVSPNGRFELLLQADGNMVIYDRSVTPNAAIWSTGTGLSTADPSVAYRTLYFYDTLGNLYCVEQHGDAATGTACPATPPGPTDAPVAPDPNNAWRRRLFAYDSLSRLRWASNPESGVITYTYDADGNLLQKTSPAPNPNPPQPTQTVSYCYDELHRITGKGYGAQSCPLTTAVVSYAYDSGGANAKGKLTSLTDQAGTATYTYDILGRLATETRTLAGANNGTISKTVSYEYNLDGSLYKLHYPSGNVITYTPWNNGNVAVSIPMEAKDQGSGINYITGATYGADISLAGFVSGSGGPAAITNSFTYNKRLQPVTMSAAAPSQTVYSIGYDFHAGNGTPGSGTDNGNVFGIINYKDTTHGRDQIFTYDALNRLTSAQNAGTDCSVLVLQNKTEYWGNSYGYDAWGNLLQKTITKCGAEHFSVTADAHNWIHSTAPDYQYDAAGNMTFDATASLAYTFDEENRLTGAAGYTYTYDADGNRVRKSNGNLAANGTLYWYMAPGIVSETDLAGTIKSEYIFFDGERVARRDGATGTGGVFYYFSDHLKTASVITDSAGVIKAESDYYPWGGELQFVNNDSNDYKFTGKKRDTETGLDYFGARYYSNGLGRWVSADWSAKPIPVPYADFIDPQSLNQYGYVRNLPTTRIDADGHEGGTAAATWDLVTGGAEGAEISGGLWAVGSVALPGLLGGGLGYVAVNTAAENNNIVANAQMQDVIASNKLIMAQQAALSKDAQAGALIKEGKDANATAKATVEAAIAALAAGKYKDATDVQAHIDKLKEGMKDVARATEALKNAVGQKARDAAKEVLRKVIKEVKGHEKDLRTKPPKPKSQK